MSSFLGKMFGKKEKPAAASMAPVVAPPPGSGTSGAPSKTNDVFGNIQTLEERKRLNERRIEELDRLITADTEEAKKYLEKNDKSRAMVVLKRKKLRETERTNKLNFIVSLETQISELQQALGQIEDVRAQQAYTNAMKDMQKLVDPEKVIQMQEDVEDARDKMREVQDILYTQPISEHDADLEAEMAELMNEAHAEKVADLALPAPVSEPMPKVTAPPQKAKPISVDDELEALQREMGMA